MALWIHRKRPSAHHHHHAEAEAPSQKLVDAFRDLKAWRLNKGSDQDGKLFRNKLAGAETDEAVEDGASREDRDRRSRGRNPAEKDGQPPRRGASDTGRRRRSTEIDDAVEDTPSGDRDGGAGEHGRGEGSNDRRGSDEKAPDADVKEARSAAGRDGLTRATPRRKPEGNDSFVPLPPARQGLIPVTDLFNRWQAKIPAARMFDPTAPRPAPSRSRTWKKAESIKLYSAKFFEVTHKPTPAYEAFSPPSRPQAGHPAQLPSGLSAKLAAARPICGFVPDHAPIVIPQLKYAAYKPSPSPPPGKRDHVVARWTFLLGMTAPMRHVAGDYDPPALQGAAAPPSLIPEATVPSALTAPKRYLAFEASDPSAKVPRGGARHEPFQPAPVSATEVWQPGSLRRSPPMSGNGLQALVEHGIRARPISAASLARAAAVD